MLEQLDTSIQNLKEPYIGDLSLPQPSWLHNIPEEDEWHFTTHFSGEEATEGKMSWRYNSFNSSGSGVLTGRYSYWIKVGKHLAYHTMESDKTKCSKTTTLAVYAREIRTLCNWLCFEQKCISVSSITPKDVSEFEKYIRTLKVSVCTVITKLIVVRLLWTLRSELGFGLLFNPYIEMGSLKKKAKKLGYKNGHTKTIKPNDLFMMINFALENLENADEWMEHLELRMKLEGDYVQPGQAFQLKTGITAGELIDKVRLLYASSVVIILSLLAERKHELISEMKYDTVIELLEGDLQELTGTVHKTAKTSSGQKTERPVIQEVKTALKVIIALTSYRRKEYSGNLLLLNLPIGYSASTNPKTEMQGRGLYSLLDNFSKACEYSQKLLPHMFRRAFSLIWAWKYDIGDFHLLSKMLYHNNEGFTKAYTEDEDVWEFIPEAQQELAYEIMENALLGKIAISGRFGKVLERYKRIIMSSVTIISPEKIHSYLENIFKGRGYWVVAHNDGYCFMSLNRGKKARCSKDGIKPNYSNRNEALCVGCLNFGVDDSREDYWEIRQKNHTKVYESTTIPMLKESSRQGVNRANTVLKWIRKKLTKE